MSAEPATVTSDLMQESGKAACWVISEVWWYRCSQ